MEGEQNKLNQLLIRSAVNGNLFNVQRALQKGAHVNAFDFWKITSLHYASMRGFKDIILCLLSAGADVSMTDMDDWTALHYVSENGLIDVVVLFTQHGANINAITKRKSTPIMLAAQYGHTDVVYYLLRKGVNLHLNDVYGRTALHWAANVGQVQIAKLLLEEGYVSHNTKDKIGDTPLMIACRKGHYLIAKYLLGKGASWHALNKDGDTALSLARKCGINDSKKLINYFDEAILLQALDEGCVTLKIIKMLIAGPPAVGKTSFKHLLFNWEPPILHHSTPIADQPIRAIDRVAGLDNKKRWEVITTKDLMQMLAADIQARAISKEFLPTFKVESPKAMSSDLRQLPDTMTYSTQPMESSVFPQIVLDTEEMPSSFPHVLSKTNITTTSQPPNREYEIDKSRDTTVIVNAVQEVPSFKTKIADLHGTSSEAKLGLVQTDPDNSTSITELGQSSDDFRPDAINNVDIKEKSVLQLSQDILKEMQGNTSQQLSHSTWIYVLDSGGQPQFADVSRAFVRGNTINIIVHKLTDRLSSRPVFQYSVNGKPLTQPKELRMTNLQLITTHVRSISSARLAAVHGSDPMPLFIIIGTYEDKMGGLRWLFQESLKQKNIKLISALKQYKDQLIFFNEAEHQLIFPVNNMCLQNREELSMRLRAYVTGHHKAVIEKEVPIRWYVLESNIKEEGDKQQHGIVSRSYYEEIGKKLGMNEVQIMRAICFLKSLSVFLHFETCPDIIFTNPQYFLNVLSSIISISFVDFPQKLLNKGKILPPDAHRKLQKEGLFTDDLLDLISIPFSPLFKKVDLLCLLSHLCIVARVQRDNLTYYFMPCALRPKQLTYRERKKYCRTCEPLLLLFQCGVVPQGLFPAVIVALLNRKYPPIFTLECLTADFPCQLRFAVKLQSKKPYGSLLLVDEMVWMEVYWTGQPTECFMLQSVIAAAVVSCAKPLAYNESSIQYDPAILCNQEHQPQHDLLCIHPALVTVGSDTIPIASCTAQDLPPVVLTRKYQHWMLSTSHAIAQVSQPKAHLNSIDVGMKPEKLDLLRLLTPVAYKWRQIGEALRIDYGILKSIQHDPVYSNDDRLLEVLQFWFDKQPSEVSWRSIISAIELPPVNNSSVACTMRDFISKVYD